MKSDIIEKLGITTPGPLETKAVNGFDKYLIRSDGVVMSGARGGLKEIKRPLNKKGYEMAMLYGNNKRKFYAVHRLVAEHFIPNPFNLPQVNHIDGNKRNNYMENLEWVFASKNIQHSYDNGLTPKGEKHHQSKLTRENVAEIKKLLKDGMHSQRQIAKMFNVSQCPISEIKRGIIWKDV